MNQFKERTQIQIVPKNTQKPLAPMRMETSSVVPFPRSLSGRRPGLTPEDQQQGRRLCDKLLGHSSGEIAQMTFDTLQTIQMLYKEPWNGTLDEESERMIFKKKLKALNLTFGCHVILSTGMALGVRWIDLAACFG